MATSVPVPMATPRSAWASAGRVVDAVADHRDPAALGLEPLDRRVLVAGQHLGDDVVRGDADLARDGVGGRPRVAGEQPDVEPGRAQLAHRLGRTRP